MVRCPKCGSEDYAILYIDEHDEASDGEGLLRFSKVKCNDCRKRFFIKETFKFVDAENWGDYWE